MTPIRSQTAAYAARGEALAHAATDRLMPLPAVIATTGASRTAIYRWMQDGTFPKSRKLGPRRIGWLASEINAWIGSRQIAA